MKSLNKLTGGRDRITLDPSWQVERPEVRSPDRIWYELIPCKGGAFTRLYCDATLPCPLWAGGCPLRRTDCREHGDHILKLWTPRPKSARAIWGKIKKEESTYLSPMDGEADVFSPARLLPLVAELAGARRRRRLTPEARAQLVERGRAALETLRKTNVMREKPAPF
jgi:hypothetical protein